MRSRAFQKTLFLTLFSIVSCVNPSETESSSSSTNSTNPASTTTNTTDQRRPTPTPTSTATPTPTSTTSPIPSPTVIPSATPSSVPSSGDLTGSAALDDEEWAFITLINDYRAQNGAVKLQVSIKLTQASDWMSTDMATQNYFDHTDSLSRDPFVRMTAFGYSNSGYRGENIAAGNSTAQATFTQWKNSPGHNANMLSTSYNVIGIGRAYNAQSSYGWYWTTDFGSVVDATLK